VELTGKDGWPVQTEEVHWLQHCTLEEKRTILEIAERATERARVDQLTRSFSDP
jgi:hypothetical protein